MSNPSNQILVKSGHQNCSTFSLEFRFLFNHRFFQFFKLQENLRSSPSKGKGSGDESPCSLPYGSHQLPAVHIYQHTYICGQNFRIAVSYYNLDFLHFCRKFLFGTMHLQISVRKTFLKKKYQKRFETACYLFLPTLYNFTRAITVKKISLLFCTQCSQILVNQIVREKKIHKNLDSLFFKIFTPTTVNIIKIRVFLVFSINLLYSTRNSYLK